jgi:hypothetical protein
MSLLKMTSYEVAREYDTQSMMNFKVIIDTLKTARELMEKAYHNRFSAYEVEIVPKFAGRSRHDPMQATFIEYIGDDESFQFDTEFMGYEFMSYDKSGLNIDGVSPMSFHQIFLDFDLYDVTEEKLQDRAQRQRQYETTTTSEEEEEEEEYIDDDISDQQTCLCCCNVSSEQMDDALENASKLPEGLYVYYADLLKKLYKSSPKIVISKKRYLNFLMREIQLNIEIEKKKSKRRRTRRINS